MYAHYLTPKHSHYTVLCHYISVEREKLLSTHKLICIDLPDGILYLHKGMA